MRLPLTISFVMALAACETPRKQPPPAPAAPPPATAPTTTGPVGSQDLAPLAGLASRLHEESAHRPAGTVTAESLFSALAAKGVALASQHQVLAATAQAQYCALGVTAENVAIAVCEYGSAAAARAGKHLLDTRYAKLVPDAVRTVHGATLVTVANGTRHPDVRERVLETLHSL